MTYNPRFECTNNMEKYDALILDLKDAILLKIKNLQIYGDLHLIVNQINDIYTTKDYKCLPYRLVVVDLLHQFDKYNIKNILTINNKYGDPMTSVTSFAPIEVGDEEKILKIKNLGTPPYVYNDSDNESYCVT